MVYEDMNITFGWFSLIIALLLLCLVVLAISSDVSIIKWILKSKKNIEWNINKYIIYYAFSHLLWIILCCVMVLIVIIIRATNDADNDRFDTALLCSVQHLYQSTSILVMSFGACPAIMWFFTCYNWFEKWEQYSIVLKIIFTFIIGSVYVTNQWQCFSDSVELLNYPFWTSLAMILVIVIVLIVLKCKTASATQRSNKSCYITVSFIAVIPWVVDTMLILGAIGLAYLKQVVILVYFTFIMKLLTLVLIFLSPYLVLRRFKGYIQNRGEILSEQMESNAEEVLQQIYMNQ